MADDLANGDPSKGHGDLLLPACPICVRGKVVKDLTDRQNESYVCTNCTSKLSETVFGFVYATVDETYARSADDIKSETFTKPRLIELSVETSKTEKSPLTGAPASGRGASARPKPTAAPEPLLDKLVVPPGGPSKPKPKPLVSGRRTRKSEAKVDGQALLRDLMGDDEAAASKVQDDDLWWEIDEEELAKRNAKQGPPSQAPKKSGDLGIDDLLGDLQK